MSRRLYSEAMLAVHKYLSGVFRVFCSFSYYWRVYVDIRMGRKRLTTPNYARKKDRENRKRNGTTVGPEINSVAAATSDE